MCLRRVAAALLLAGNALAAAPPRPEIRVATSVLRGTTTDGVASFRNIPYAGAPIGPLRWHSPEPALPWKDVRDATRSGPACYQELVKPWDRYGPEFIEPGPVSEDCLTLNVWKPVTAKRALPVYVYIHGGRFRGGSGALPIYDGGMLARLGVVVVTINYRVGVFRFLAHPAFSKESARRSSGNFGIEDQIAALRWVRDNIARFGGDPAGVTVGGEFAGAASVNILIASPAARSLFARAVSMSGPVLGGAMETLSESERIGSAVVDRLANGSIARLRAMPADDVLAATRGAPPAPGTPLARFPFVPNVDETIVPVDPSARGVAIASTVPVLAGYNAAEKLDARVRTPDAFRAAVAQRYGRFADRFLTFYPHATEAKVAQSHAFLNRDRYMAALLVWGRDRVAGTGQLIYPYLYDHPYPAIRGGRSFGAFHSSALPYIFGTLGQGDRIVDARDQAVSRRMQDHWVAFIATGDPSTGGRRWPRLTARSTEVEGLGDTLGTRPAVSSPERLRLFEAYVAAGNAIGLI